MNTIQLLFCFLLQVTTNITAICKELGLCLPGRSWEQWKYRQLPQTDGQARHTARSDPGQAAGSELDGSQPCKHTCTSMNTGCVQRWARGLTPMKENSPCVDSWVLFFLFVNPVIKLEDRQKEQAERSFQVILMTFSSQIFPPWILIKDLSIAKDFTAYHSHAPVPLQSFFQWSRCLYGQ